MQVGEKWLGSRAYFREGRLAAESIERKASFGSNFLEADLAFLTGRARRRTETHPLGSPNGNSGQKSV